jgi:hypothetical protein
LTPAQLTSAAGPARPSLRLGVEVEGRYKGALTLVVLGRVPWRVVRRHAPRAGHVFWELAHGQRPWRAVRALLAGQKLVTVDLADPALVPPDVRPHVEVMARVPEAWLSADSLKVCDGSFGVAWSTLGWRWNGPQDYEGDEELWRGNK